MDQFNVMPPVNPGPNQPMHQPENSTPPPETPNISGMMPEGPGKFKRIVTKFRLKYLLIIPILLVLALLVFGYLIVAKGQTKYGEQLQNDLWKKIITHSADESKDMELKITYTDSGEYQFKPSNFIKPFEPSAKAEDYQDLDDQYSFTIKDPSASVKYTAYQDLSKTEIPKIDLELNGVVSNNQKDFEGSLALKLLENESYAKYNYNTNVEDLLKYLGLSSSSDSDKDQWFQSKQEPDIKDLRELVQVITSFKSPTNTDEQNKFDYQKLLEDHRLFDIDSLKGVSLMNGKPTLHYSLKLNKAMLRELLSKSLDETLPDDYDAELKNFAMEVNDAILEKINVNNYEVWVGVSDRKLYKSKMNIDALSITKTAKYFEDSINDPNNPITKGLMESTKISQNQAKDAKRVADVRQMASALELYFNDNQTYPESKDGQPVGLSPTYLGQIPTSPEPPDGDCDTYYNTYWYTKISPTKYSLSFCLGEQTAGIPAGISTMTEAGIQSQQSFDPSKQSSDTYYDTNGADYFESFKSAVINTIKEMSFDAKIVIEYSAKNFGEIREIKAPGDFKEDKTTNSDDVIFAE